MTERNYHRMSVVWFVAAVFGMSVFYVILLRQFGALPEVRRNAQSILHLEAAVDSLRMEIRHVQP